VQDLGLDLDPDLAALRTSRAAEVVPTSAAMKTAEEEEEDRVE
jgi:hypothetical protein